MEALKKYPTEYSKCFQASFSLLNRSNIRYFADHVPFVTKYWRFLYIVPIVVSLLAASTTHLCILILNRKMAKFAYLLPAYLITIHASLKSIVIIPKSSKITNIIKELGDIWRTTLNEKQNAEKNAMLKSLNSCNGAFYWIALLGTAQYLLTPLFETLVRRYVLKQDFQLLLPVEASYPVDPTESWFTYIPLYASQFYTMFMLVFVYTGSELMMITLCALLGTEFTLLTEDLTNGDEENNVKDFMKRHQKLIKLCRQLDEVFNPLIFIDLMFVGVTTCAFVFASGFASGLAYSINNYVAVGSCQATVLYLCYHGELLTRASARIGDVAYESQWYTNSKEYKKTVYLIIIMSQNPCRLTSMKYATVSLSMFAKVISTTWSYLSLLNSVDIKVETDKHT